MQKQIQVSELVNSNIKRVKKSDIDDAISLANNYDVVFSVGGQSNAAGSGGITTFNGKYSNPACLLYTKKETIEVCSEPSGVRDGGEWVDNIPSGGSTSAPEYSLVSSFANAIANITGARPLMVPNAIGSTTFAHWAAPATEDDRTTLFGAMTYRTKRAIDGIKPGTVPIFLWFGHESAGAAITEDLALGTQDNSYIEDWINLVRDIRARFPLSPIIYAQLATHNTGSLATNQRKAAESQRLSESVHGDTDTEIVEWIDPGFIDLADFTVRTNTENTSEVNVITFNDGKMQLVTDTSGAQSPQGSMAILTPGKYYKVNLTVTGTGTWRFFSDLSQIGSSTRAPNATVDVEFLAAADISGTYPQYGRIRLTRTAATAVNLEFTINSITEAVYPSVDNCHMAVSHDLPRIANDGYHLTPAGYDEIGYRLAKVYAQDVLGMQWINGRGPRLVSVTLPTTSTVLVTFDKEIQVDANDYGVNLAASLFRVYDDGSEATLVSVERDTNTSAILITLDGATSGIVVVTYGDRAGPNDGTSRVGVVKDNDDMPAPMFGPIIAV